MLRGGLFLIVQFCAPLLYAAVDEQTASPSKVTDPVGAGDFAQVLLGLGIVVVAIFAMAWVIKRTGYVNSRASGALKVIGGLSLTQRERILLVQVGEKQLLLGVAPGRITTLHELEQNIELSKPSDVEGESFANKLHSILRGERPS